MQYLPYNLPISFQRRLKFSFQSFSNHFPEATCAWQEKTAVCLSDRGQRGEGNEKMSTKRREMNVVTAMTTLTKPKPLESTSLHLQETHQGTRGGSRFTAPTELKRTPKGRFSDAGEAFLGLTLHSRRSKEIAEMSILGHFQSRSRSAVFYLRL